MPIDVYCDGCEQIYRVPDSAQGKRIRCPQGHTLTVSSLAASAATPPPPRPEAGAAVSRTVVVGIVAAALLVLLIIGGTVALILVLNGRAASVPVANLSSGDSSPSREEPRRDSVRTEPNEALPSVGPGRKEGNDGPETPASKGQNPPESRKPAAKLGFLDLAARIVVEHPLPPPQKTDPPVPDVWEGHTNHVRGVAFTDDGKYVVSVSGDVYPVKPAREHDYSIRVWDVRWGKQVHKVEGFAEPLDGVSVTPGGRYAVFGHSGHWGKDNDWIDSRDHSVRLFDLQEKREVPFEGSAAAQSGQGEGRFRGLYASVFCTAISPDNTRIIGGDNTGKVVIWDAKTGQELVSGEVPSQGVVRGVSSIKFTPDGRQFLADSGDDRLRLFEAQKGKFVRDFGNHLDLVWSVAIATMGEKVVALSGGGGQQAAGSNGIQNVPGARDYAIRLWDLYQGKEIRRFAGHEDAVRSVAFCPNGRHFLSGSKDKSVRLWDLATGRQLRLLGRHEAAIRSVAVAPDGRTAVSGGDDCKVRYWHLPAQGADLAATLKNNDLAALQKAVGDIDTMGPDLLRAYPEVVKTLTHSDAAFQEQAVRVVTSIAAYCRENDTAPEQPQVGELVRVLKSPGSPERRQAVALLLGVIGPATREAVPALCDLLGGTEDSRLLATAAEALGKIGDPRALPALEKALRHADAAVRAPAAAAVVRIGPEAIPLRTFFDLLQTDASAEVRAEAEKGLRSKLSSLTKEDIPQLREGLKSGKVQMCGFCADAVARVGPEAKEAVPELIPLLQDADRDVCWHAVLALRAIGEASRPALPELERLLAVEDDKDRCVAAAAALALLKLDPSVKKEKLTEVLLKGLKPEAMPDRDDTVAQTFAEQCRDALIDLGKPAAKPLLKAVEVTFRGSDRLNIEARANVYRILARLKGKALTEDAGQVLSICIRREADLARNSPANTLEGEQRRKTHELAKKAFDCVINDKD
jgi:WD40 repeat protein/HEAT repeat protein